MSYGYGLGVYWEDYNEPEEPDADWCTACAASLDECGCPEVSFANVKCEVCAKQFETIDEGEFTETICPDCTAEPDYEPPF